MYDKVGIYFSNRPVVEDELLPLIDVVVDGVDVEDNNGGVDDVVEEDQEWDYHVGKINIPSC